MEYWAKWCDGFEMWRFLCNCEEFNKGKFHMLTEMNALILCALYLHWRASCLFKCECICTVMKLSQNKSKHLQSARRVGSFSEAHMKTFHIITCVFNCYYSLCFYNSLHWLLPTGGVKDVPECINKPLNLFTTTLLTCI